MASGDAGSPPKVGFYKRFFAWLQTRGTEGFEEDIAPRKQALFADLSGDILEIGPGGGPNLRYLHPAVRWIGVEPNPHMHGYLRETARAHNLDVDLRMGTAGALPVDDASMDAVISTHVLCSVPDLAQTLREIQRVLKPGGRFLFVEHVAAPPGTWTRRTQNTVRPVWRLIADGCRPNRETWQAIEDAGFAQVEYEHFTMSIPLAGPHITGYAVKG